MSLHLTRDEADRIAADGWGVLFRAAIVCQWCLGATEGCADGCPHGDPPAEFVEAAQACETCGGTGLVNCVYHGRRIEGRCTDCWTKPVHDCPDCLNGQRRVAVVVPAIDGPGTYGPTTSGTVTVGHVVATSGPDLQDDGTWSLTVEVAP